LKRIVVGRTGECMVGPELFPDSLPLEVLRGRRAAAVCVQRLGCAGLALSR